MKITKHFGLAGRIAVCLATLASFSTRADDLFTLTVDDFTTDTTSVTGSHTLVGLVEDVIKGQNQFTSLKNDDFTASLTYAGLKNAVNLSVVSGTSNVTATLDLKGVIQNKQFTGTTRDDVANQIKDFFLKEGSSDLASFMANLNQKTPAGVTDGNPNAATARSADVNFNTYSFGSTETASEETAKENNTKTSSLGLTMTAETGTFSSGGVKGSTLDWTPILPIAFGEEHRVRLDIGLPISYTEIDGAKEFGAGIQLALPVMIVKHTADQPWTWQVTPIGGTTAAGSEDLASGGVMAFGGMASFLSYHWNHWEFSMGNGAMFYDGLTLSFGGNSYPTDVSQQILKNGLKVGRQLGERWYAEAYYIDTEFLQAAFTPRYSTVGGSVGYRGPKGKGYVMLGIFADFAPGYTSAKFQFGTGWKF